MQAVRRAPVITLTSVNLSARATSRKKVAFLWFDSTSVRGMAGAQIFRGSAGKPAPEPMSRTCVGIARSPGVPRTRASGGVREEVAGQKQGLAEMAGHDMFRLPDGGQIDAGVPAQQQIDVRRYLLELHFGECPAFEKGIEQGGDAGEVHRRLGL